MQQPRLLSLFCDLHDLGLTPKIRVIPRARVEESQPGYASRWNAALAFSTQDIIVNERETFRLTDELERQLMRQAIEEQFRPRPLRALGKMIAKVGRSLRAPAARHGEAASA
jgi:hypothetical protein